LERIAKLDALVRQQGVDRLGDRRDQLGKGGGLYVGRSVQLSEGILGGAIRSRQDSSSSLVLHSLPASTSGNLMQRRFSVPPNLPVGARTCGEFCGFVVDVDQIDPGSYRSAR
jgi:hypothetical protein